MLYTFLVLVIVSTASAQTLGRGRCASTVTTKQDFDIEKYMGSWFEITRIPNWFQRGLKCVNSTYELQDNGHVRVEHFGIDESGVTDSIVGDGKVMDEAEPAKLGVKFFYTWDPYWVIKTDHDSYSLVWSCINMAGLTHLEYAWILSRKPTLEPEVVDRLTELGRSMGIRVEDMVPGDQSC